MRVLYILSLFLSATYTPDKLKLPTVYGILLTKIQNFREAVIFLNSACIALSSGLIHTRDVSILLWVRLIHFCFMSVAGFLFGSRSSSTDMS